MAEKKKLNAEDLKRLEVMSSLRLPLEHTATILGMSKTTLERRIKKNAAVREAVERGRASASSKIRMTLFRAATETSEQIEEFQSTRYDKKEKRYVPVTKTKKTVKPPSVDAMKFWCESQEGFRRTERLEIAREAALGAEFENLTDDQIAERVRKMEKVTT